MTAVLPLLRFLRERQTRGERCALVTLTDVTGSAARAPGEHMAVAADGSALGSFSGGCIEAAVIAEAQEVVAEGKARLVRFGAGSPYIDVRLPCGGGIDLLFTPDPELAQIERAIAIAEARSPVALAMTVSSAFVAEAAGAIVTGWNDAVFSVRHDPPLRIAILGHGAEPLALHDLATAYGAEILLLSPQQSLVDEAHGRGARAHLLRMLGRSEHLDIDAWTAVVTLFHDHDWETDLLRQSIEQTPFFIGAMGSRKTHAERCRRLLEAGADANAVAGIVGPIGLLPASRDPRTLALSIMAQLVPAYEVALAVQSASTRSRSSTLNTAHRFIEPAARSVGEPEALHPLRGVAAL